MPSADYQLSSYDYELPQKLIAQHPAAERDQSRMLLLERQSGQITHHNFAEIVSLLPESSCLVINNTKVLPAKKKKRTKKKKLKKIFLDLESW